MKKQSQQLPLTIFGMVILSFLTLFIAVCNKKNAFATTEETLQTTLAQDQGEIFTGHTYIKVSENNEVLIMQIKNDPAIVENIFVLALEKKDLITIQPGDLGLSSVIYYRDKRAVVLHSSKSNNLHFLGLRETASGIKMERLKADHTLKNEMRSAVLGYGLSMMKGKWDAKTLLNTNKKYIFNLIALADRSGRTLTPAQREAVTEDIASGCTSGGPGSSSCSISEPLPPQSCSVTCGSGYYACCQSSTVSCNCVANSTNPGDDDDDHPALPRWAQCGGLGYNGPGNCAAPYSCVYVNDFFSQCQ
ncbi:hypothetical protein [Niastella caeni]|nr:hypothetical protein [Niastella caeni]